MYNNVIIYDIRLFNDFVMEWDKYINLIIDRKIIYLKNKNISKIILELVSIYSIFIHKN